MSEDEWREYSLALARRAFIAGRYASAAACYRSAGLYAVGTAVECTSGERRALNYPGSPECSSLGPHKSAVKHWKLPI